MTGGNIASRQACVCHRPPSSRPLVTQLGADRFIALDPPEILTAAHGPRMLALTGAKADGWLPTKMTAPDYGRSLAAISRAATAAGRDPRHDRPVHRAPLVQA